MSKIDQELEFLISQNLNNLADLPDNEDLIVKYLIHRYERGEIYTWIGPVLLSMNPRIASADLNLYDQTHEDNYTKLPRALDKEALKIKPHVFAVAASARYRLTHDLGKVDQIIVISGDSGSGKTFSASKILRFLAATNEKLYNNDRSPFSTLSKIEKACLVISAFSTATTERNKSSSRHGQLVQLQYLNSSIQGAVLNSFLLERTRVTNGCNNFHIFGQMLEGLSATELNDLKLSRNAFYKIANSEVTGFDRTFKAMDSLGLGEDIRKEIFKVIALLMHLGNVEFNELATTGCEVDTTKKDSADALEGASELLELPISNLVKLLTTNLIRPCSKSRRHSTYHSAIASIEACNTRLHSIIRYLYYRLFQWLLNRLNEILACRAEESPKLLGILDIFGFEFFSENSIEQLSINYANERMQNHFMQKYLEASRLELENEGLSALPHPPTSHIYKQRLAAIEGSLFPALNDACLIARIEKHANLNQLAFSAREGIGKFIHNKGEKFAVCHYSCIVEYRTEDILRKNTDKVPAELRSTFTLGENKFVQSLLDNDEKSYETEHEQGRSKVDKKKNTALAKLKHSMDELIKELDKYDLHYIRCVKPVHHLEDQVMMKEFKEQLACSGILDVLPLARSKFRIRLRYDEFGKRYSKRAETFHGIGDPVIMQSCRMILRRILNEEEFLSLVHFGSGLIFLAEIVLYKLEAMRDEFLSQCASRIQNFWYKYRSRKLSRVHKSSIQSADSEVRRPDQKIPFLDTKKKGFSRTIEGSVIDSNKLTNLIVDLNNQSFFHRNRILSRRRLADIPVRFHTRLTCLLESHRLPQAELPRGLKDCL